MLKCEACGHEIEGLVCSACQGENQPDARFCCHCGHSLAKRSYRASAKFGPSDDPYDIKNRILCSDEACIGIINEKGVCTDCGRPYGFQEEE